MIVMKFIIIDSRIDVKMFIWFKNIGYYWGLNNNINGSDDIYDYECR